MKYRCPSCKVRWQDSVEPMHLLTEPLCIYCSNKRTESELISHQIDLLDHITEPDKTVVLKNIFKNFSRVINSIQETLDESKEEK